MRFFTILLFILASFLAHAQIDTLTFIITDEYDREPIENVNFVVTRKNGTIIEGISDSLGIFKYTDSVGAIVSIKAFNFNKTHFKFDSLVVEQQTIQKSINRLFEIPLEMIDIYAERPKLIRCEYPNWPCTFYFSSFSEKAVLGGIQMTNGALLLC